MQIALKILDRQLSRLSNGWILSISCCGTLLIAIVNFLMGYEISVSVLYLAPVAVASWYGGRRPSIISSALACSCWLAADLGAGHTYSYLLIPFWNALVRLGFFLITGLLLVSLKDSLNHQRELARTDALTGVFGRRAFEERLEHDLDLARRNRNPLTLAFVDLDNFKNLNDMHGHNIGDQALRVTARVLTQATRREDTIARLGGDEFALVFPDTDHQGAEEVIDKLMNNLRDAFKTVAPELTCSIGVITFDGSVPDFTKAVGVADSLMYQAKSMGKDMVTYRIDAGSAYYSRRSQSAAGIQ